MGIKVAYMSVRENIIMMDPLPSLDTTYNILLQGKRQRQMSLNSQISSIFASFSVNVNRGAITSLSMQFIQRVNFIPNNQNPYKTTLI